ncbi:MAG: thioredoxin family protein, partial [Rhodospirillales bacterium]|nr:thioredoxin family protein [Rhodospirillales bacterium]
GAAGEPGFLAAAALSAAMCGLILWRGRLGRWAAPAAIVAALLAIVAPGVLTVASRPVAAAGDDRWVRVDPTRDIAAQIAAARDGGKIVLVDVTADWCVTCQVNKKLVLNADAIVERLRAAKAVSLKVDWTRPSDPIAKYLAANGRYGIPFNIVYGPGAPDGVALPELLTSDAVLAALDKAAKR